MSTSAASSFRTRPRGYLRHYAGLMTPGAGAAIPALLERNRRQRLERLLRAAAGAGGGGGGRRRADRRRMRALLAAPGARMHWHSVPAPGPAGPEQAIVHPLAASTCDIDCPLALGAMNLALPVHLGHECVAEVMAVGERVRSVKPGDRVVVPFQISCGSCSPCRSGHPGSCLSTPPLSAFGMGVGSGHFGGAFSDELVVPYADAMLPRRATRPDRVGAARAARPGARTARRAFERRSASPRPDPHRPRRHLHEQRRPAPQYQYPPDADVHPPLHTAYRHSTRTHQHPRRTRVDRQRKAAPRAGHHQHCPIRRRSTRPARALPRRIDKDSARVRSLM
jgi:hypothetical protein